jgi:quinoprotein glucose dehydrogenase
MSKGCRRSLKLCSALAGFACLVLPAWSQWRPKESEWPTYTADLAGSKYRPLDQIDGSNFKKLEIAWRFKTDNLGTRPEYKLEGTPLMVNGVIYATGGTRRAVVALEAKTGELIWMHSVREGVRAAISPRQLSGRGLAFWSDGKGDDRIIYVTTGYRLMELNARNGQPIQSFGKEGLVDLKVGMVTGSGQQIDLEQGEAGLHSAPTVVNDVVIVGSAFKEGMTVPTHNNTKGLVRAFDVKSGKLIWTFHTIPKPGEFGGESWENNSWATNGNTGVWTQITVDPQLGLVYLPVESPTSDFYGGERPGNNLFGESLVAVDLKTGQRKWHYQIVHHPIWDYDLSSAPLLMDIRVNGKAVKAVAVPTKESFLYVFDRATGKPVWPIEERAVPQSDVPGEKSSPTQPFPTRPPAYARAWLKIPDDLIDFTPEMRAEAIERLKHHRVEGMFTPPVVGDPNKFLGGISMGNATGGTNWAGGGFDPETHTVYVQAANAFVSSVSLRKSPEGFSDIRYVAGREDQPFRVMEGPGYGSAADAQQPKRPQGGRGAVAEAPAGAGRGAAGGGGAAGSLLIQGLPIVKPPYGVLSAIDLDKGDLKWQVPYGETPDNIRLHPALKGKEIPNTGMNGYNGCGVLVTKTLVIIGDTQVTSVTHPRGAMMRAYDKATGKEVGAVWMPAPVSGSPMTYMWQGKQYIVIAVSGGNYSGEYLAFALPDAE